MRRELSEYDWYWMGKSMKAKEATEEFIEVLKQKYITQDSIAEKYGLSPTVLKNHVAELVKKNLIDIPIHTYVQDNICVICKVNKADQKHHLNYNPEVIIDVCLFCHGLIHNKNRINKVKTKTENPSPFLSVLPFFILDKDGNPIGNKEYGNIKYYMRLLREWRRTHNVDEIKVMAQNMGFNVVDKSY